MRRARQPRGDSSRCSSDPAPAMPRPPRRPARRSGPDGEVGVHPGRIVTRDVADDDVVAGRKIDLQVRRRLPRRCFRLRPRDVRSSESSSTSGAELATGSLAAERSVRTTTNSCSVVPPFLMWNVTGPAGAFMLPRSILNSDSVAATVVADPDPDGLRSGGRRRRMPEIAADDAAGADCGRRRAAARTAAAHDQGSGGAHRRRRDGQTSSEKGAHRFGSSRRRASCRYTYALRRLSDRVGHRLIWRLPIR